MPKFPFGSDSIAHELFQLCRFWKSTLFRAREQQLFVEMNVKHATAPRNQCDLPKLLSEGREQFLGKPRSSEQPSTLRAVSDLQSWGRHVCRLLWPAMRRNTVPPTS